MHPLIHSLLLLFQHLRVLALLQALEYLRGQLAGAVVSRLHKLGLE